ncbi:MAG: sodium/solute symporter [Sedimentisphaerales bacterium]|nr:sodium/solute symporter [Sedimentisphaerales bacterium]
MAAIQIGQLDLAIIIFYLLGIVALGCLAGLRLRRATGSENYFLAGGTLRWPVIGLALFSTNISTIHLVSQAEEGYMNGLAYGNMEWMAAFTLIALSLFFAPFYIRSRVTTLPDFLEKRYNAACRNWLAVLSVFSAIFIHIGFSLYTGALVLKGMFGIRIMTSIIAISVLTGLYTIIGGLLAVVVTESIQTVVLLLGAICITAIGYVKVGGWAGISASVEPVKLTVLRGADDPSHLPWYSVFLGYPIIGLWYWCADQTIVQRVLGAKDENHARVGPLFAGFIKILPVFIFVLPGTICLALINKGLIPALEDSADTYSHLIKELLPPGLKGIVAAALLAALMGTVSGALNSIATLFSYDIYKPLRPQTSEKQLVLIGRVVTFLAMVLAIAWSPYIARFESIYQGCVNLICAIAPPITVVFVWGVFWRRASSLAAQVTLYVGSALGLVVFLMDWFKERPALAFWKELNIPGMMSTFYLSVICSVLLVVVSLWNPESLTTAKQRLVWSNWREPLASPGWKGLGDYRILSLILFVTMVVLYVIFA